MTVSVRVAFLSIAVVLASAGAAPAQPGADRVAAMKKLAWMRGVWSGPATRRGREGPYPITQTERVGPLLGGDVLLVEGRSYKPDGTTVFNGLAVISWDAAKGYEMRAYAYGHAGTFKLSVADGGWTWARPMGRGLIRYTAEFKDGLWRETGDAVFPNAPPTRIFEGDLKRVGDTDWPHDKPVAPAGR
jgi:hypothetical protein